MAEDNRVTAKTSTGTLRFVMDEESGTLRVNITTARLPMFVDVTFDASPEDTARILEWMSKNARRG